MHAIINFHLVLAECNGEQCPRYSSCHTDNSTGQSTCVPDCQVLNGGCPADQACRLVTSHGVQEGSDDSDDSDLDGLDGDGLDGDGGGGNGDGGGGSDDDGGNNGGRGGSDGHGGGGGGGRRGRRQSNIDGDGSGDDDDDNHLPNNYYINCIAVPYGTCPSSLVYSLNVLSYQMMPPKGVNPEYAEEGGRG